jgi:hypothetical protein
MTDMKPRYVICPSCRVREPLTPGSMFTYIDMWVHVSKTHQDRGCSRSGYALWGFEPLWDSQTPRTLRSEAKMRLVQHPDGYMTLLPAVWDKDRQEAFFVMTRQKKRKKA